MNAPSSGAAGRVGGGVGTAAILSVGDELVLGQIADTNAAHMARVLWAEGWPVAEVCVCGDERARLVGTLTRLAQSHAVLLLSGGLGPTPDDLTRQALADAAGVQLELVPALLEQIETRFRAINRPMTASNRVQAFLPQGATGLRNRAGTAPGVRLELGACTCFAMPGVPAEMRTMLAEEVVPVLGPGPAGPLVLKELHLWGLGESRVGEALRDLMAPGAVPCVGTRVRDSIITVRLRAQQVDRAAANAAVAAAEAAVRKRLGAYIFGADETSLPEAVVSRLAARGLTLALAESCTGGWVGKLITDVPGSSAVFTEGFVTYSNEAKVRRLGVPQALLEAHGAVSEPVARAMATGVRAVGGSDFGIGITGVAGPGGGTEEKPVGLVHVAVAHSGGVAHRACQFRYGRNGNRARAVHTALGMLWEHMEAGAE